jgi:hypothetical protein
MRFANRVTVLSLVFGMDSSWVGGTGRRAFLAWAAVVPAISPDSGAKDLIAGGDLLKLSGRVGSGDGSTLGRPVPAQCGQIAQIGVKWADAWVGVATLAALVDWRHSPAKSNQAAQHV